MAPFARIVAILLCLSRAIADEECSSNVNLDEQSMLQVSQLSTQEMVEGRAQQGRARGPMDSDDDEEAAPEWTHEDCVHQCPTKVTQDDCFEANDLGCGWHR